MLKSSQLRKSTGYNLHDHGLILPQLESSLLQKYLIICV